MMTSFFVRPWDPKAASEATRKKHICSKPWKSGVRGEDKLKEQRKEGSDFCDPGPREGAPEKPFGPFLRSLPLRKNN